MKGVVLLAGALAAALTWALPVRAGEPVAIVEEITALDPRVALMDYLEAGQVITLASGEMVTLGYLRSCWRETITGGTVLVGTEKSSVKGGEVRRERVECHGGSMELTASEAGKSGVMVFRAIPAGARGNLPEPQLTLFGASPVISLAQAGGSVVIERLDKPGETLEVAVPGKFVDLAQSNQSLAPGGLYRVRTVTHAVVFEIDPFAQPGTGPIIGRLIRF